MSENSQENLPNPLDFVYFFQLQKQLQIIKDSANLEKKEKGELQKISNVPNSLGGTTKVESTINSEHIANYVQAKRNLREIHKAYYENNNTDKFALMETLRFFSAVFLNGLIFISSPFFNFQPIPESSQQLISQFSEQDIFLQDEGVDDFIVDEINTIQQKNNTIKSQVRNYPKSEILQKLKDEGIDSFVNSITNEKGLSQLDSSTLKTLCQSLMDNQPLVPKIAEQDITDFVDKVNTQKSIDIVEHLFELIFKQPSFRSLSGIIAEIQKNKALEADDKSKIRQYLTRLQSFVQRNNGLNDFQINKDGACTIIGNERQPFHDLLIEIMLQSGVVENQNKIREAFKTGALSRTEYGKLKEAFDKEYPDQSNRFSFR